MNAGFLVLTVLLRLSIDVKALQVIGGNVTVVQGRTAVLPCKLTPTEELISQISWQRKTRGKPNKDNFFTILPKSGPLYINGYDGRFKFIGSVDDRNGSLQLDNVRLLDEGVYSCIFTLFPSGNYKTEIPLNILVPPVTSVKYYTPFLGIEEVSLAICTAAGSKPPADVKWLTGNLTQNLKTTTNSTEHTDGTVTTVSTLFGIPNKEINHHPVTCVVTSPALSEADVLPLTLQVHFSPNEVKINERPKHSFECLTEANPTANITWSRSGHWPLSGVKSVGPILTLLTISSDLNGLYYCEAANIYGRKYGQLYVHVTSGACTACWVLFGLLLVFIACGLAAFFYIKKHRRSTSNPPEDQSSATPLRAKRKEEEEEEEGI
ncbi:Nectin-4 Ig superfamily receptor LNIR Nectin cell adhesion molecule 4 [Channa argus]|uniref:Nectin-4 Ig superfamily receptor LNIR Nectin cell adhesion molecule 4 n=1 Tax=Channa argus TaxID=215402 RepID=A0A6G1PWW1_CHAAH|nr:Nectin-4 Ig superfamily receptor LNIR Nectin cell adhesion molecule 4 [Channa argus]KAK2905984.1 hypothetical protein Q8A73_009927 [Channa argus]